MFSSGFQSTSELDGDFIRTSFFRSIVFQEKTSIFVVCLLSTLLYSMMSIVRSRSGEKFDVNVSDGYGLDGFKEPSFSPPLPGI